MIHLELLAENVEAVFDFRHIAAHIFGELQRVFKLRKQADYMNLLRGCQLHSGNNRYPRLLCRIERSGAVESRVVICQRNQIKPHNLCHIDKIIGRHLIVSAGRQT